MLKPFTIFSLSLFSFLFSFLSNLIIHWAGNTGGGGGEGVAGGSWGSVPLPSLFRVAERKKENKGKKERVLKQKLLNGCDQDQDVTVLVSLDRL